MKGLPAKGSALDIGAEALARDKVIVKHVSSIQNLGSIDVLCSDKTGTLTAGTLPLERSVDPLGRASQAPLQLAALNSTSQTAVKSPLDAAIAAGQGSVPTGFAKTDEIPFDFERRRVSVVLRRNGRYLFVTKGAPESIVPVCSSYESTGRCARSTRRRRRRASPRSER